MREASHRAYAAAKTIWCIHASDVIIYRVVHCLELRGHTLYHSEDGMERRGTAARVDEFGTVRVTSAKKVRSWPRLGATI
jgi:hypothetical protein